MRKIKLSTHKKMHKDSGFITLEIIVAILIALGFVLVSMQTLVYAMMIKVQAQEKQRANQLIQEDIESIQAQGSSLNVRLASILTNNTSVCSSANYAGGYAQALWHSYTNTDYDDDVYSSPIIDDNGAEVDLDWMNLNQNIADNPTNSNWAVNPTKNLLTGGRQIRLDRTHIPNSTAPYRTLKIQYQVQKQNDDGTFNTADPVLETYVEIIPDAALSCP